MSEFRVLNPDFAQTVHDSFTQQGLMGFLGAILEAVEPGYARIALPFHAGLTQQNGFFHAGAVTSIVDSACGYAAATLLPPGGEVLSVEFKINLLAPARGEAIVAHGRVIKPGRTLTVCQGEVLAVRDSQETLCALMQATMISRHPTTA